MSQVRTIAITTGGGDAPGLNAVIRAVVKSAALQYKWNVIGVEDGFDGLIWPERKLRPLGMKDVSGILPRGGTILGTTNRGNPFAYKVHEGNQEIVKDYSGEVIRNARQAGIDALIVIGGDGTQAIGYELHKRGLPVVGVPKTIDNDLMATDTTFGFDTALHTATDAIDKIHTTAESHHRVMFIEVMGRDAGHIALHAGVAGGAHVILLPEIPFTIKKVCDFVHQREVFGKRFTIVVVAEGATPPADLMEHIQHERRAQARPKQIASALADAVARVLHRELRVTVLGHIQRGGSPSPLDRVLATRFGVAATELIARGDFGKMVAVKGGDIVGVDLCDACGQVKTVDPNGDIVRTAKAIGISFGD